jgi:hypothetical protein
MSFTNTNNNQSNINIDCNQSSNNMNNKKDIIHIELNNLESKLEEWMFTCKNLSRFTIHNPEIINTNNKNGKNDNKNGNKNGNKNDKNNNFNKNNFNNKNRENISPYQKDQLFWCFYILKNGIDNYDLIDNRHFIIEKDVKYKYIELLRSKKDILKFNKIKPLYELEDDLANKEKIGLKTFIALCLIENINIVIIHKRKIFESIIKDSEPINIITKNDTNILKYTLDLPCFKLNYNDEKLVHFRTNYFHWKSIDATLKAMSAYKLDELIDIAKQLNIEEFFNNSIKKKTKKEIYELILLHF